MRRPHSRMATAMSILAGRYQLERRLGGGGMAEVFLAKLVGKDGFSRPVAIKRVLAHLATDEAFAKMFVAEAQMCAKLQHPNIVSVLDFDRDEEGRPFLVIELVDGPSLAELDGALPIAASVHLATELLRGLAYAHDLPTRSDEGGEGGVRGIVHRDISPHNVLLSWEGAVKLSDFGIAKARAASGVTASEMLKGKPAYMSPEQANGESLDGRSDLFSVGIVVWELLVGRTLFSGHTTQETLARVLFAPIPSARSIRSEIPEDVDRVVMKLLARERKDRYADANDAIADLVACKDHPRDGREKLVALLADRFAANAPQRDRMLADVPTVRTPAEYAPTLPSPRDAKRSRMRPILLALAGLAIVGGAVAITLAVARRSGESKPSVPTPIAAPVNVDAAIDGIEVAIVAPGNTAPDAPPNAPAPGTSIDASVHPVVDVMSKTPRDASTPNNPGDASSSKASDASVSSPPRDRSKAPMEPKVDRAAIRAKLLADTNNTGRTLFSLPMRIDATVALNLARKEAERLLGPTPTVYVNVNEIDPDGMLDLGAGQHSGLEFVFRLPDALDDGALCVEFSKRREGGVTETLVKNNPGFCRAARPMGTKPRCTFDEVRKRALELGMPPDASMNAMWLGGDWVVNDTKWRATVSDCR
jgi:serine/threonine protein kinase